MRVRLRLADSAPLIWRTLDIDDVLKENASACEPQQNWLRIVESLHRPRSSLKVVFRYYALAGTSASVDDDPNTMNMSQVTPTR